MKVGTRVRNKLTGAIAHVVSDSFGVCGDSEELLVYDGTSYGCGTDKDEIEEIEQIVPIPNPEECGAGKGEKCCIFLTVSAKGFECERFSGLRDTLIFRTMNAKRHPEEPYPDCMEFGICKVIVSLAVSSFVESKS